MCSIHATTSVAKPKAPDISSDSTAEAAGLPPERVGGLLETIALIARGDYLAVPPGTCPLSAALRDLARSLGKRDSGSLRNVVALSVSINDSVAATAELSRSTREASTRSQTIAAAAEEMVASVQSIADNAGQVAASTDSVRVAMGEGREGSERAVSSIGRITAAVQAAEERVGELGQAVEEIRTIVDVIEEIAFQTNMLALNASVEAARAGSAGKGFAVVAEEVRRLADQTKKATVEISGRIGHLGSGMASITRSMHEVGEAVGEGRREISHTGAAIAAAALQMDDVAGRIQDVAGIIDEQRAAVSQVAEAVTIIADMTDRISRQVDAILDSMEVSDGLLNSELEALSRRSLPNLVIHRAKSDHVLWKKRLAAMLAGRAELKDHELVDHHSCRLGRWYDQVNDPRLTGHPAFGALAEPHAAVHARGRRAVELYRRGDMDAALAELQAVSEASAKVLSLLEDLTRR